MAFFPAAGVCAALAIVVFASAEEKAVLFPLTAILTAGGWFFSIVVHREGGSAPLRIGTFYAAMVLLYAVFPLVMFYANGMTYGFWDDIRLYAAQPTPQEIGAIAWWYFAYIAPYLLGYLLVARRLRPLRVVLPSRTGTLLFLTVAVYAGIQIYLFALQRFFGLRADTYYETYTVLRSLPLIVQQVTGRLQAWTPMLQIFLLLILFKDYRKNRVYILLLLAWVALTTMMRMHARTELFLLIVAAGFLYHHMVRRFSVRLVVAAGVALVGLFTLLGALRNMVGQTDVDLKAMLRGTNEFQAILSNAVDLRYVQHASGAFLHRPDLYFADFLLVIPSQLLPFPKQTASLWYLETYYPALYEAGGGMAFGAVAEAIVGYGILEAVVRGLIVALLFGLVDRVFSSRPVSVWLGAYYVWLTVLSYQSFRSTSFAFITYTIQLFLIPAALLWMLFWIGTRIGSPVKSRSTVAATAR